MMPSYNKQVDWKPLLRGDDKENIPLDFNTSAYFPSSPTSSENSSDFSDWLSPGFRPIKGCNRTFAVPTPFLDSSNTTSPCSSGYGSDIKAPTTSVENAFKIHRDEFCSSFDSLLKPLQSYSSNSDETTTSTIPSFSYSPLSSFNFADWKSFGSELFGELRIEVKRRHVFIRFRSQTSHHHHHRRCWRTIVCITLKLDVSSSRTGRRRTTRRTSVRRSARRR